MCPEKQTQDQRRPVEAGQESSDGKVSIFRIPSIMEVSEGLTFLWKSAYIVLIWGGYLYSNFYS